MSLLKPAPDADADLIQQMIHSYWYRAEFRHDSPKRWRRVIEAVASELEKWAQEPEAHSHQSVALTYLAAADRLRGVPND